MKRAFLAVCALGFGLALSGCVVGDMGARFQKTVEESRPLAANGELRLENTNGSVRLTAWDEPRVKIEAVKHVLVEPALFGLQRRADTHHTVERPRTLGRAHQAKIRDTPGLQVIQLFS